jgi:hypothetical protein
MSAEDSGKALATFASSISAKLPRMNKDQKFLVAYYGPTTDSLYTEGHVKYADAEDKITFVHLAEECLKDLDITEKKPTIVFFRDFKKVKDGESHPEGTVGEDLHIYTGGPDKDAL